MLTLPRVFNVLGALKLTYPDDMSRAVVEDCYRALAKADVPEPALVVMARRAQEPCVGEAVEPYRDVDLGEAGVGG